MIKTKLLFSIIVLLLWFNNVIAGILSDELQTKIARADSNEFIRTVISMKDRPSVEKLRTLSSGKSKQEARILIINYVKDYILQTQWEVIKLLNQSKLNGEVRLVYSIPVINKIVIESKKSIFQKLLLRNDIGLIYTEQPVFVLSGNVWGVEKINAHITWQQAGIYGRGVRVGVIDTGIDYNHTDLHSNIWNNLGEDADGDGHTLEWNGTRWVLDPGDINGIDDDENGYADDIIGYDFFNDGGNQDYDPMDENAHGTHVSGTIAGNGTGGTQTGVAPEATLMALKVYESGGTGFPSYVMSAIWYGIENGADVLSMSSGLCICGK